MLVLSKLFLMHWTSAVMGTWRLLCLMHRRCTQHIWKWLKIEIFTRMA